ncbi:MAG: hypothetical protein J6M02_05730 [Clostridia bacterium]|nr:hypothetical protein [Clostridia bacterium]
MKKKLFRSFIVSLFVFTLFISVSNAYEFALYETVLPGYEEANFKTLSSSTQYGNYTLGQIKSLVYNYNKNGYESSSVSDDYNAMIQNLTDNGYFFWNQNNSNNPGYFTIGLFTDLGIKTCSDGETINLSQGYMGIDSGGWYAYYNGTNYCYYDITANSCYPRNFSNMLMDGTCNFINLPVKKLVYTGSNDYSWQGEYWYIPPISLVPVESEEPEVPGGPEFSTELTDDEIASVVQNFTNSSYWKNRNSNYTGFFIQRNELNGHYAVMIVPYNLIQYKFLSGIYIPANVSSSKYSAMDHDTYSIKYDDDNFGFQLPWNKWRQSFKIYDSSDGVNFNYTGEMHLSDYGQYRIPMTTPIIYSSFKIPFKTLIGEKIDEDGETVDNYSELTDYNFSDLVNSETGENYVFEDVPVEDNPVIQSLKELFNDLGSMIVAAFGFTVDKLTELADAAFASYGENVGTFIFGIVIKAFSVLFSSIFLLVRFAGFLLTLVAIPADVTLFNVAVDGVAWGTNFIEGLNFLKSLSWNNLNFWLLFECFASSLEIICFVKIIRRHYNQYF